jgi:hypothetical protein
MLSAARCYAMATANGSEISLRLEPGAYKRLGLALGISAAIHLVFILFWFLFSTGKLNWLTQALPAWLKPESVLAEILKQKQPPKPQDEVPTVFVEVNPQQAVSEPPKKTEYYSDKNSRAANPEPTVDTPVPNIDGKRTDMVKTEDVLKNKTFPLAPSLPPQKAKEEQPEQNAKPRYTPGDMVMAKPSPTPKKTPGEDAQDRPRTLAEAKARNPNNRLVGEKMKQEGSIKRRSLMSSLDVTATEFGAYDLKIITAVQNRWYDLLEHRNYAGEESGRVTLRFRLNADGSIAQVAFVESTVDLALGMLCQSAIKDPAPFDPWPSDMRRKIGDSFREVTFTFFYN